MASSLVGVRTRILVTLTRAGRNNRRSRIGRKKAAVLPNNKITSWIMIDTAKLNDTLNNQDKQSLSKINTN